MKNTLRFYNCLVLSGLENAESNCRKIDVVTWQICKDKTDRTFRDSIKNRMLCRIALLVINNSFLTSKIRCKSRYSIFK